MSWLTEMIDFFKSVFSGLTELFITTDNKQILFLFAIPLVLVSVLTVVLEYVFPLILGADFLLFRRNASRLDFQNESLNYNLERAMNKYKHFSTFDFDSVNGVNRSVFRRIIRHPFSWFRFKNNQRDLEKSVVLSKVYDEYRQEFKETYGIDPNNQQLQQFIRSGGLFKFWRKKKNTRAKVSDTVNAEVVINGQTVNVSSKNGKTTISVNTNQLEQNNGVAVETDAPRIENK